MAGKRRPALAAFVLSLLLHVGDVTSSNYGYVEWSDQDGDPEVTTKPEAQVTTERTVLAHKIEEDLPRVVTAFLHTGDSSTLRRAPCSRRYELSSLRGGPRLGPPHHALHGVLDGVVHATGFLTAFLQSNGSRAHGLRQNWRWYHALIQSLLEGDARIRRAVVTVNTEVTSPGPHLFLQATRVDGEVTLQDLSATAGRLLRNRTAEWDWFTEFRDRAKLHLRRKAKGGDGPSPERSHVKWSAPFLDCENGSFIPHWLLTLSAGLYSLRPNLAPEFRGVVRVDVNLQDVDIDQCSSKGWFAGTHRCNMSTMECKPILGYGFVLDKYKCHCRKGFYHPSSVSVNGLQRREKPPISLGSVQEEEAAEAVGICLPCQEGCAYCKDDTPCLAQEDGHLRVALLCLQGLCVLSVCICMLLVYRFRRNKRIRASGLVLLEVILAGSLLLYMPEMMLYLQPGVLRCVLLRWLRLLGFATVYGTVILKLYRVLKVFLSRTAQRIPYMTSWRVLRLLAFILLVVCWFLVAWTSAVCQDLERGLSPIEVGFTPEGLQFSMCLLDRWDYMMAVAEVLFLLWGVYLCYAVRTVPSAFHEPRYLAVAIYNELIISAVFHVIRFTLAPGLHPDWLLMLFFAHTQLTVTVTLGLLLVPKFLFAGTPARDDIATEAYEDELDMGRSGSYLNSSITSAWSEHSLDPEDIREELKKLYAQLEIYKRKKMLANNPHLQKKRSSKKGLGRSLMKRITEIPETMSRQCNREDKDVGDHGFSRNSLCTLRRSPHDTSHLAKQKEDSLKNKVFSLKKSHSTYDHVRDQSQVVNTPANDKMEVSTTESSLLDTLMGKKLAKKSLEKVEGESTESVPLVCKSASAHNLTIEKKPIHLRTSMLQKSLSVIANAKEKTLGLTAKTHSVEDSSKKGPNKNKENVAVTDVNETSECYPKMIISQSVEYRQTPNKTGNMKHQVSGSQPSICSESGRNKDLYDLSEVCPWEVEDLPTPSENKIQKHVSIAPREATTIHGGGPKMKMQQRQKVLDRQSSTSKRSNQKTAERQNLSTKEEAVESHGIKKGVKPQVPLNLSMNPSNKANLCSWDFEETTDKMDASCSPEKFRRKKSVTPTEGKCKSLHSDHSKSTGSLLGPPVSRADICTWDYEARPTTGSEQTQVLKVKESHFKKKGSSTKGSEREKIKEKDEEKRKSKSKDKASSKATEKRRVSQSKAAEIGPRDAATNEPASANSKADVCPWDFPDVSGSKEQNHRHSAGNGSAPAVKGGLPSNAQLADVCPWDCDDTISGKHA